MFHIGKIIEEEVHKQGRTIKWVSEQLHCDRTNVYDIFKRKSIDTDKLFRISIILNHNFFKYYEEEFNMGSNTK